MYTTAIGVALFVVAPLIAMPNSVAGALLTAFGFVGVSFCYAIHITKRAKNAEDLQWARSLPFLIVAGAAALLHATAGPLFANNPIIGHLGGLFLLASMTLFWWLVRQPRRAAPNR